MKSYGDLKANEIFMTAVCQMPFTRSMSGRRRIANRAPARHVRRLEAHQGEQETM